MGMKKICETIDAARHDPTTLPMALPRARKVSIPSTVMPIKDAHEPRTSMLKKIMPTAKRTSIPRVIKRNWLKVTPRASVDGLSGVTRSLLSTPVSR